MSACAVAACALFAATVGTAAAADTPTPQSLATRSSWLPYAPPPSRAPRGVCLVDTGVDVTGGTAKVRRTTVVGDGAVGDVDPEHHGTFMALLAGAPADGWGPPGAWPGAPVVSVRAARGGAILSSDDVLAGVRACADHARDWRVSVVNLSLNEIPSGDPVADGALWSQAVDRAHAAGLSVVASAGNGGGALEPPASTPGVLSVGAVDATGALAAFSGRPARLLAPGENVVTGDPATGHPVHATGTSDATAIVSGLLAALRSEKPGLSPAAAEDLLVATGRPTPDGPVVDAEAAFRRAGLGAVVDAALRAERAWDGGPQAARIRMGDARRLVLDLAGRPAGAVAHVAVARPGAPRVHAIARRSRFRLAVGRWSWLRVVYTARGLPPSPPLVLHRCRPWRAHSVRVSARPCPRP